MVLGCHLAFKLAMKNPKIIHFIGGDKPWNKDSKRLFKDKFFYYLNLTPYKNHAFKDSNQKRITSQKSIKILGFPLLEYTRYSNNKTKINLLNITIIRITRDISAVRTQTTMYLLGIFPIISSKLIKNNGKTISLLGIPVIRLKKQIPSKN